MTRYFGKMARCCALVFSLLILAALVNLGCKTAEEASDYDFESGLILISLDGFRWDYMEKADTPNLDRLVANGVKAEGLTPVFPSKTFPNHYSVVTGLYAENHGIVANNMYDPVFGSSFSLGNQEAMQDGRWWGGEPIWVTVEKQGKIAATYFWPGSEAEISGYRPTHYVPYDGSVPNRDRVNQVLTWLDLPEDERPSFLTLYFSDTDSRGHQYGPDSPEVAQAIAHVDSMLGLLLAGLSERNLDDKLNIIVTSDHGMARTSPERVVFLDDYVSLDEVHVVDWTPVVMIRPNEGEEDNVYNSLADKHPNLKVYRKNEVPDRLHFNDHYRIPEIIGIADEGWSITSHSYFERSEHRFSGAAHGYDNRLKSMLGIFIAHGPAFNNGLVVDAFENIHIYNLMASILELEPATNDGDLDVVKGMLR